MESLVGVRGFEPPAPASRRQCSTRLSYTPTVARGLQRSARFGNRGLQIQRINLSVRNAVPTPGEPETPGRDLDRRTGVFSEASLLASRKTI